MDTEGIAGAIFVMAGIIVLITNIFISKDHMGFIFVFIIISAGMILLGISRILDKLSDMEEKIKKS